MTLQQFLDDVPLAEREALEAAWTRVDEAMREKGLSHVPETVEDECRLPEEAWAHLFEVLLDWQRLLDALDDAANATDGEGADMVAAAMTKVFQSRTLHGPDIEDTPTPKGRAIPVPDFSGLMEETQAFSSANAREQFFNDRRAGHSPTDPYDQQLRNCSLGRYLIWSTFQPSVDDPFEGLPDAATVREGMGLPPPQGAQDRELVLLVYEVPADLPVRYPTVADAYAGEEWPPRFECSNPDDPWGYTEGGRPEVVHDVIDGKHLVRENDYALQAIRIIR
jgi:hypothetical protein